MNQPLSSKPTMAENYDAGLGPVLFDPFAKLLAKKIKLGPGQKILELACGTGILTRRILELDPDIELTATDLSPEMIVFARNTLVGLNLDFAAADAQELPFENALFDAVVCQFEFMFFPDKDKAFVEAHRVLRKGGQLLFSVWDDIAFNPRSALVPKILK